MRSTFWRYLPLVAFGVLLAAPPWATTALVGVALGMAVLRIGRSLARRANDRRDKARDTIELGRDLHGRRVTITESDLSAHGLILGASGSGKTTALTTILEQQIRQGRPVVAIDMKGSPVFAGRLAEAAAAAGRPFKLWTPDGPNFWNPLQHGNATELKDKLICTERFTEPHYQRAAERYLQTILQVLQHAHPDRRPTLAEVVTLMDPRRLPVMLREVPTPLASRVQDYLAAITPDQRSAIRGLQTRLAIITESECGPYLAPAEGAVDVARAEGAIDVAPAEGAIDVARAERAIYLAPAEGAVDVAAALAGREVVVFSLNSSRYGQFAAQLGTLAVQDLICATGDRLDQLRRGDRLEQATIAIDEFSGIGGAHMVALFARGREAGISGLVATQELADLDRAGRGVRDQILGNTAVKLILRQDVPESADLVAQLAGTEKVWEETRQIGGSIFAGLPPGGTRREAERFVVHPNTVKSLGTGDAILISKLRGGRAQTVRVMPPGGAPARRRDSAVPPPVRRRDSGGVERG